MKSKFIKVNKPCNEKWQNMESNENGRFCSLCSKNVIDFTKLNSEEITNRIKESNGNICARVTQKQLNIPLSDFETKKQYEFPYSNIAAGLMIAATLTASQVTHAKNTNVQTELVQTTSNISKHSVNSKTSKSSKHKLSNNTIFSGKIYSEENGSPIENAKITFVTIQKMITTYTAKDGTFSMEIPTNLIDNDNVIRVSYDEVINDDKESFGYDSNDYVLSKKEMNSNYIIKAKPLVLILGGIEAYYEETTPIVISNGREIKYKDFIKALHGKKSSCSLENKIIII